MGSARRKTPKERNRRLSLREDPIRKILDAVQSLGGNAEAQDDRTLVVLERIK